MHVMHYLELNHKIYHELNNDAQFLYENLHIPQQPQYEVLYLVTLLHIVHEFLFEILKLFFLFFVDSPYH